MADTNCNHSVPDPSCDVCGLMPLARNHYFDGKFMATRQFQVEQDYVRGANQRQNAYMHGMGTVCGLKITEHDNGDCRNQFVVLMPGLAVDCCGREIVVPKKKVLDVRTRVMEKLAAMGANPPDLTTGDRAAYILRIVLKYRQVGAEPVPALLDDCDDGGGEECDQIVESYDWDVTLDRETASREGDVLKPSLEWRQTLTVARPAAAVIDRDSERLYVAEMAAGGGAVRVFDSRTHNLLARAVVSIPTPGAPGEAETPARPIAALALSRSGERLYVALDPIGNLPGGILLVDRGALEAGALPNPSAQPLPSIELAAGQRVVGLAAAARDDALLALTADDAAPAAMLRRWSADAIAGYLTNPAAGQPPATDRDLTALLRATPNNEAAADIRPVDMVQDVDGRWLVIADVTDGSAGRLIALSLPGFNAAGAAPENFIRAFELGPGRVPRSIDLTYDGGYAYTVVSDDAAPPAAPATSLLRLKTDPTDLSAYLPQSLPLNDRIRELPLAMEGDAPGGPDAIDAVVTPRDNFVCVLRRAGGPGFGGNLLIVDAEQVDQLPPGPIADRAAWQANPDNVKRKENALRAGPVVQDEVDFQALAPLGRRLYVATHHEPPPPAASQQAQAIFDGRLRVYDIDEAACDAKLRAIVEECPTCGSSRPLVLATISHYYYDKPMVEVMPSDNSPFNLIDNFSERPLAPSNVVLRETIECLIEKGIAEGIPGPRGPQGQQGEPGEPGGVGLPGPRGPGVVEVEYRDGLQAPELEPIANDPEGDFTLLLPPPVVAEPARANHVIAANFLNEEIFDIDRFVKRFTNQSGDNRLNGFLIAFEETVRAGSLNNRTAYALIHGGKSLGNVIVLPLLALPVDFQPVSSRIDTQVLDGYRPVGIREAEALTLSVDKLVFDPNGEADGVLLCFDTGEQGAEQLYDLIVRTAAPEQFPTRFDSTSKQLPPLCQVRIVLRGDQIMTRDDFFLDGNNLSGAPGMGFPSGNGTPGGDWVAVIHLAVPKPQ